jgi:predicted aconitase with swiveling domain
MNTVPSPFQVMSRVLVAGEAEGTALVLSEPLSLWGGLDPESGEIIDRRHPASGEIVSGHVLVLPAGRGSSSASSILLEAVRLETAPAAIITAEPDPILALGATVARELYGRTIPVLVIEGPDYELLQSGWRIRVHLDGSVIAAQGTV